MTSGSRSPALHSLLVAGTAAATLAILPGHAQAEDLVLMNEPTSFTDVVDAFDDHDVFDLNLQVGYLRSWELGHITRERNTSGASTGRAADSLVDVGNYSLERNGLLFGLDIGIFRDLALYGRLPLILSDDRSITPSGNFVASTIDAGGSPLFDLPSGGFHSPTRSGVDWVSVGLAWSILNQHRDRFVPTWVLMVEGRLNVGTPMRACESTDAGNTCRGDLASDGSVVASSDPGVGRGVNALRVETRASFREGSVEPYAGLMAQIEWPGSAGGQYLPSGDLQGYINRLPPIQGRFTAGLAILPWEDRQHFQRFTFDLRFMGDYVSEGHDYSPLFDALGSSRNTYLSTPIYNGVPTTSNPSTDGLSLVQFNGLTDTQSHGRIGGQISLEMQAAQYVRFQVGTLFMWSSPYNLTQADACNPNVRQTAITDDRLVGDCRASSISGNTSIINPHNRSVIDLPGNRFRIEDLWSIDLYANVTAMF